MENRDNRVHRARSSDMVDSKNDEAQLDFFCSNRCMMVHKSLKLSGTIVHLFLSLYLSVFPIVVVVLVMSFYICVVMFKLLSDTLVYFLGSSLIVPSYFIL